MTSVLHESCWQSINAKVASLVFGLLASIWGEISRGGQGTPLPKATPLANPVTPTPPDLAWGGLYGYAYTSLIRRVYVYPYTKTMSVQGTCIHAYTLRILSPWRYNTDPCARVYAVAALCALLNIVSSRSVYKLCTVSAEYTWVNIYLHSVLQFGAQSLHVCMDPHTHG